MEKKLELNEAKCKAIFKSISIPIYTWQKIDDDLILIDYNIAAEEITKGGIKDYIGKKASEMYKNQPEILSEFYKCSNKQINISRDMEYKYMSTGDEKHLSVKYNFVPPDLVVVYTEDITERKKAEHELKESEEKLRESEERYRTIFETIPTSIVLVDKEGQIVDINPYHIVHIGKGKTLKEDYVGKNIISHPSIVNAGLSEDYKKVFEGNSLDKRGIFFPTLTSGIEGHFNVRAAPLMKNKEVIGGIFTHEDITESKKAEQKIKESEEKYRSLVEGLSSVEIGIDIVSNDYKVLYQNQILKERFGDITRKECYKGYMGLKDPCEFCPMVKAIKNNRIETVELTAADGRNYELISAPFPNPDGSIDKAAEVVIDITERKKAEQKLKKSEKKYRESYNRAEFYKDIFAHDINNILQNIQSSNELLSIYLKDPIKEIDTEEMTSIIEEQVKRGATLVSNIRCLSEIEGSEIILKKIEVCEVIKNTNQYIVDSFKDRRINIQVDSSEKRFYIKANELLFDVFENLLTNAVKHNDNPIVEILINISKEERSGIHYIKLALIDNGRGIPENVKEKVFQRANKKEKTSSGLGLGLSLVKKIIDKYNGKIWVEDKVKGEYIKGSNFIILIPEAG